jgi:N-acetylglucosamine-6-phosphate deacetylase
MASLYPADFLGLDRHRGRIAAGYLADLVHLDDALIAKRTWIKGRESPLPAGRGAGVRG